MDINFESGLSMTHIQIGNDGTICAFFETNDSYRVPIRVSFTKESLNNPLFAQVRDFLESVILSREKLN